MADTAESVILIHGLWMHGVVLLPQQRRLERLGFTVRRFSYPSWRWPLERNVARLAEFVAGTAAARIHLVGHSLGGLLALAWLARCPDSRLGRLVMLGTPCAGCHCGAYLAARPALSPVLGRCIMDCLAGPPPTLPPGVEAGIIAGDLAWGLGRLLPGLPSPNDGVVAVAETLLPGARDHIVLPVNHSGMLLSPLCAAQIASFLRCGEFIHA